MLITDNPERGKGINIQTFIINEVYNHNHGIQKKINKNNVKRRMNMSINLKIICNIFYKVQYSQSALQCNFGI